MGRHRARRTIAAALCAGIALLAVPVTAGAADAAEDAATTASTVSTTAVEAVEAPDLDADDAVDDGPVDDGAVDDNAVDHDAVDGGAVDDESGADPGTTVGSEDPQPTAPSGPSEPTEPAKPTEPAEPKEPTEPTEPTKPPEPAELPGPAPTIEARCWMGHHQPVYVLRNLDREHGLRYVLSSPGAGKRGQLSPRGEGRDSVWFVGTGSFPNPSTVRADYEIGGASGSVVAPEVEPAYCTYAVRPIVRWLDADFDDVMPTAGQVAGWSLTLEGALGSLDCSWNGAGLTCHYAAKEDAPLPEGTYYSLGRETELRVPAFGDTSFHVRASADPEGFRLAGGLGDTVLPDVGDGLDQSSVDDRAGWFFPARLQGGTASQLLTVTFESVDLGPTDVRGTSTVRPDPAAVVPAAAVAVAGAPRVEASSTAPAFMLPATGGAPTGLVGLGLGLVLLGLSAGLVATRTARREPS